MSRGEKSAQKLTGSPLKQVTYVVSCYRISWHSLHPDPVTALPTEYCPSTGDLVRGHVTFRTTTGVSRTERHQDRHFILLSRYIYGKDSMFIIKTDRYIVYDDTEHENNTWVYAFRLNDFFSTLIIRDGSRTHIHKEFSIY